MPHPAVNSGVGPVLAAALCLGALVGVGCAPKEAATNGGPGAGASPPPTRATAPAAAPAAPAAPGAAPAPAASGATAQQVGDQRMRAITQKAQELKKAYPDKSDAEIGAMATETVDRQAMPGAGGGGAPPQ